MALSEQQRPVLPRLITDIPAHGRLMPGGLATAIYEALHLPSDDDDDNDDSPADSLSPIDGDTVAAAAAAVESMLRQTSPKVQITPVSAMTSPSSGGEDIFVRRQRLASLSLSSYGSLGLTATSSTTSAEPQSPPRPQSKAELVAFLLSASKASQICLVTPRAGPFEGQLVALFTLPDVVGSESQNISLPPTSDTDSYTKHIRSLKTSVLEWSCHPSQVQPEIWIPLQSMALNNQNQPDSRCLQTWIQNINQDAYEQVLKLQLSEPRRRIASAKHRLSGASSAPSSSAAAAWIEDGIGSDWEDPVIPLSEVEFYPLSAMQQLYFGTFMDRERGKCSLSEPGFRFNQSIMLRIKGGTDVADIEASLEALVSRHEMLRARYRLVEGNWTQMILPRASNSYRFTHHTAATDDEVLAMIEKAQVIINPIDGPVFAAEFIRTANKGQLLYLIAHHLVVDLISWRVITHDLDELLQQGTLLSEGSISFPYWIDHQNYRIEQGDLEPEVTFHHAPADLGYWGLDESTNCYIDAEKIGFTLDLDSTSALQDSCQRVFRTEAVNVFLSALSLSFSQSFPDRASPMIWKQEHGRDTSRPDFNIMETVGWFTSLCPIKIEADVMLDMLGLLKVVKDTRHAIPQHGISSFLTEFSTPERCNNKLPLEVMFSYIDNLQQIERPDGILELVSNSEQEGGSLGSHVGDRVGRLAVFEISVFIDDSGAHVELTYNGYSSHGDRIAMWMQCFERLIRETIDRLRYHEPQLTLSDVPLLETSYRGLAKLTADRLAGLSVQDIETLYPVTPAQQEILISQAQDPESFQCHGIYELHTFDNQAVDSRRLCEAWKKIVAEEPSMRSTFIDSVSEEALFDQVVLKNVSPEMLFLDSGYPEEALTKVPSLRSKSTGPRHRLAVCQTATRMVIRIDVSQAICDTTSLDNLVAELGRVYSGEEAFHDQVLHHEYLRHVSSMENSYSIEVWKAALVDARPCLFPQLTPVATPRQQSFQLDVTREQLSLFSEDHDIDTMSLLQLSWALVVRAYSGMDQVTFGHQFSGRGEEPLPGLGGAIGSFGTILPQSVDVSASCTIDQSLKYLMEGVAHATQRQNLTLTEIQHALKLGGKRLFNTCFYFPEAEPFKKETRERPGSLTASLITSSNRSDCDISLTVMFTNDCIQLDLNTLYLSPNQIQNIASAFERALKTILEFPDCQIADIDLFTDRDYAQLVVHGWGSAQRPDKVSACLHNLILQHATSHPDAPAVCAWDGQITYCELANFAARLRTYLVNLGVGPGTTVPVILEKNRWAPVIMVAVMQAGASFVALDSQDKVTVQSTLRQLDPQTVLATETAWRDLAMTVRNLVVVNDPFFATMAPQTDCLTHEPTPEHAACVFISPGRSNTGTWKGIFFTHASLCSAFIAQGPSLKINRRSRVLQLSTFNVDIALVEVLGTMVHGGCVCIPSAQERIQNLAGAMARMDVTWSYMTGVLARRIRPDWVPSLRTLCFRTRKLDEDTIGPWAQGRDILLAYGAPDVCPLGISITQVTKPSDLSTISPPVIGRFHVINPEDPRKLMPVGAIGELTIDSPIVTPHRFKPGQSLLAPEAYYSPSERRKSQSLRTGHRVRYLDNGNIQFVSCIRDDIIVDDSVVDVARVEQHLRRCLGGTMDVVVDEVTTEDNVRILAAFLELRGSRFQGSHDLRRLSPSVKEHAFIAKKLLEMSMETRPSIPIHAVPSVFIPVKYFPISASLKINRRKLQRMVSVLTLGQLFNIASIPNEADALRTVLPQMPLPMTETEKILRGIWARVMSLPTSQVKGTSSFLGLGGDRHLATTLTIACRNAGLQVSINDLLQGLSLTEICRPMNQPAVETFLCRTPSKKVSSLDVNFIRDIIAPQMQVPWQSILDLADASPSQMRSLELAMTTPRADISCIVLTFNGSVRHQQLEAACEALSRIHPALRTGFATHDGHTYQILSGSFRPGFQRIPCSAAELDSVTRRIVQEEQNIVFKLHEPVTKFTFLDAGEQGCLVLRLSKAQIDDASTLLLIQDLTALYEEPGSTAVRSNFFEYMRAARSVNEPEGISFWAGQLQESMMTDFITHPKPCLPTSRTSTIAQTASINPVTNFGIAFDTVLKASWAIVLATLSAQTDILFGEVIHGHNIALPPKVSIASLVGPLCHAIPVRIRFPCLHSTPLDLMQHIQNQRLGNQKYEALGVLDMARHCSSWSPWTRFSTVVHHKGQPTFDEFTTLNIGSTTFTYKTAEPAVKDIPDILVCSTMETPEKVKLSIEFPEDRVEPILAEEALRLLVNAVQSLTSPQTIAQPMVPSADDILASFKRIPLLPPADVELDISMAHLLSHDQRTELQTIINRSWNTVLSPALTFNVPGVEVHRIPFYNLSGSLLPASLLASTLNDNLSSSTIPGTPGVRLTTDDIVSHPTMLSQFEHIVFILQSSASLSPPNRRRTLSFHSSSSSSQTWSPRLSPPSPSLPWKTTMRRLTTPDSKPSKRNLGGRATGWFRHHVSGSWDSVLARDKSSTRSSSWGGFEMRQGHRRATSGGAEMIVEETEATSASTRPERGDAAAAWTESPFEVSPEGSWRGR